ncbi:sphingomyelin phosphodiesterase 5-like [Pezoporus wallicus]|uniref:sphingomyelin phosphodiesterase 5-like n=1 Tax=Pezoporus wallicus TaxID=35540 RepID=UPI00254B4516|nr:sphingomyelin phosphodiesterase 5-like [Pezoporus wallicus]
MAPGALECEGVSGCGGDPALSAPPGMRLPQAPFRSPALAALDAVARALLAPGSWALNRLLDLRPTTAERRRRRPCAWCRGCAARAVAGPVLAVLLLLSLPLTALGLLLWLPLQAARSPFLYQHTAAAPAEPWDLRQPRTFTFVSANLCLLPSGLAKFSNLGQTPQRAADIARRLVPAPPDPGSDRAGLVEPRHRGANGYGGTLSTERGVALEMPEVEAPLTEPEPPMAEPEPPVTEPEPPVTEPEPPLTEPEPPLTEPEPPLTEPEPPLSERFPPAADVLCLQEVFDGAAAACLRRRLGRVFPHVISEVGTGGLRRGRLRLLGSGLFLASRFPVLAAAFRSFPNGAREDAMADKGLLMVQVQLGSARHRRIVGYVGCTHLQAPAGDGAVRDAQLTLALRWLQRFQQEQERSGDLVAFDVLCGDLNFDNCSRGDQLNQRHRLFELYQDPCRQGPGQDEPWAIGTLLNYLEIYEEPVSTPEKMKRTLSSPGGRCRFLAGPILASGLPDASFPAPCRGRRLDYAVFRPRPPLRTDVAAVSFITPEPPEPP